MLAGLIKFSNELCIVGIGWKSCDLFHRLLKKIKEMLNIENDKQRI